MDANMQLTINSFRQLFADKTFRHKSLTFPWQLSNSPTFPGFPDKWSPCVLHKWFIIMTTIVVFAVIEQQQQQPRSCWCFSTWINTWRNIILASRRLAVSVDGVWKLRQTVDVAIQLDNKVARTPNVCHKSRLCVIWTHNNSNTHIRTRKMRNRFYFILVPFMKTRGQSNLTKNASRGAHSAVRGHPRGSKVVPLNSWDRVSY